MVGSAPPPGRPPTTRVWSSATAETAPRGRHRTAAAGSRRSVVVVAVLPALHPEQHDRADTGGDQKTAEQDDQVRAEAAAVSSLFAAFAGAAWLASSVGSSSVPSSVASSVGVASGVADGVALGVASTLIARLSR